MSDAARSYRKAAQHGGFTVGTVAAKLLVENEIVTQRRLYLRLRVKFQSS